VGKATVAGVVLEQFAKIIHLDLERPADLNKLTDPEAFFTSFSDHLICLDDMLTAISVSDRGSSILF
jgi:hypothetical protein